MKKRNRNLSKVIYKALPLTPINQNRVDDAYDFIFDKTFEQIKKRSH